MTAQPVDPTTPADLSEGLGQVFDRDLSAAIDRAEAALQAAPDDLTLLGWRLMLTSLIDEAVAA